MRQALLTALLFLIHAASASDDKNVILTAPESIPFSSNELERGGFLVEITNRALRRRGYRTGLTICPPKQGIHQTVKGTFHVYVGVLETPERRDWLQFSRFAWQRREHLFARDPAPVFKNINALCPARVTVTPDSSPQRWHQTKCLVFSTRADPRDALRKLALGETDIVLSPQSAIEFALSQGVFDSRAPLMRFGPPMQQQARRIAFTRAKKNTLAADFRRGLQELWADGTYGAILRRYGLDDASNLSMIMR